MKTVLVLIGFVVAGIDPAEAQQTKKVPRIGFASGCGDPNTPGTRIEAFRQGDGSLVILKAKYSG
ncbi:MAG TPA: hypothetical protein VFP47_07640 [Pyrinomonadaceae bacterium]|nr:hypothetical protein [Pyrinomonadaceae bacterium]